MEDQENVGKRAVRKPSGSATSPSGAHPTTPVQGRRSRTWVGLLGIVVFLWSVFFVVAFLGDIFTGDDPGSDPAVLVGLAVFFLLLAACGAWMMVDNLGRPRRQGRVTMEQRILSLAEAREGRLTVDEVAAHAGLSVAQSKAALDHLVAANAAQMEVTDHGVLLYVFPGLLSAEEKRAAKLL